MVLALIPITHVCCYLNKTMQLGILQVRFKHSTTTAIHQLACSPTNLEVAPPCLELLKHGAIQ
ncbi:hypothetical protein PEC106568_10590 [Pectobacterium carotovorum subsp. carotovorum]|nr:hypothetical protein PEC106568_10590 [Pectobacterium carotovorum subsp. carotovorum]